MFRHGNDDFSVGMLVCNRYITVAVMAICFGLHHEPVFFWRGGGEGASLAS